jgi:hypothetical protein
MAGAYPDAPHRRMPWHIDGTILWKIATTQDASAGSWDQVDISTISELTNQTYRNHFNDETESTRGNNWLATGAGPLDTRWLNWGMIFPERRDLYGIFWWFDEGVREGGGSTGLKNFEVSEDTTNGIDYNWTEINGYEPGLFSRFSSGVTGEQFYRSLIFEFTATNIRGIRNIWFQDGSLSSNPVYFTMQHIYGEINDAYTPDRLLYIDASTGLEFTRVYDWADVPRGTTLSKDIRIKNNSATLTASSITLQFASLSRSSASWYEIKETGGSYSSTLVISSISPGVSYPTSPNVITIKLAVPSATNELSLHSAYLYDSGTSWA